jgi:hypothetical protein
LKSGWIFGKIYTFKYAIREGERPADLVIISVFRAVKNPEMFEEMKEPG